MCNVFVYMNYEIWSPKKDNIRKKQTENVKTIAYHDMAAEYIFIRLWSVHPSVIKRTATSSRETFQIAFADVDISRGSYGDKLCCIVLIDLIHIQFYYFKMYNAILQG